MAVERNLSLAFSLVVINIESFKLVMWIFFFRCTCWVHLKRQCQNISLCLKMQA